MNVHVWLLSIALIASGAVHADDGLLGERRGPQRGSAGSGSRPPEAPPRRGEPTRSGEASRSEGAARAGESMRESRASGGSGAGSERRSTSPFDTPRRVEGRLGGPRYGTSHNLLPNERSGPAISLDEIPLRRRDSLLRQRALSERVEAVGRYRRGYYAYDSYWRDDFFAYPFYRFEWADSCVPSPGYFYFHLPPYICAERLLDGPGTIIDFDRWRWSDYPWTDQYGDAWDGFSWGRDRGQEVDFAVGLILAVFERRDVRALARLLPTGTSVVVQLGSDIAYRLSGDDFYDLLLDLAWTSRTLRYRIERVRTAPGAIRIQARHVLLDPWGRTTNVDHDYVLRTRGWGWVVTDFRASRPRAGR